MIFKEKVVLLNWKTRIVDKLWDKHRVVPEEVEEAFQDPHAKRRKVGVLRQYKARRYLLVGKTYGSRILAVFFDVQDETGMVTPVSARNAIDAERKFYND